MQVAVVSFPTVQSGLVFYVVEDASAARQTIGAVQMKPLYRDGKVHIYQADLSMTQISGGW